MISSSSWFNIDKMGLDPRYRDYLAKKKYFKDNNIMGHDLDREYNITDQDKERIRAYFQIKNKQKTRITHDNEIDHTGFQEFQDKVSTEYVDLRQSTSPFLADQIKDKRMERIKKKQQTHTDAKHQRHNYDGIISKYDMYRDDRRFASAYGDDFRKSNFKPEQWFDETCGNTYQPNTKTQNHYKQPKPVNFSQTNTYTNPKSINNGYVFEKIESSDNTQDINKVIRGARKRDINVDNYINYGNKYSETTRSAKSIGYPNPVEHYFQYISSDHQQPDHVVNNYGIPTRSFNRSINLVAQRKLE